MNRLTAEQVQAAATDENGEERSWQETADRLNEILSPPIRRERSGVGLTVAVAASAILAFIYGMCFVIPFIEFLDRHFRAPWNEFVFVVSILGVALSIAAGVATLATRKGGV